MLQQHIPRGAHKVQQMHKIYIHLQKQELQKETENP